MEVGAGLRAVGAGLDEGGGGAGWRWGRGGAGWRVGCPWLLAAPVPLMALRAHHPGVFKVASGKRGTWSKAEIC